MENFLPGLLIIGAVIYKIYSEYQKEQEKARKRVPHTPPPAPPVADQYYPQPTVIEPTVSLPIPTLPQEKQEQRRDIPEETRRARERREAAAKSYNKTIVRPVLDLDDKEDEGTSSFDLREAVIQSAILNRPYQ